MALVACATKLTDKFHALFAPDLYC